MEWKTKSLKAWALRLYIQLKYFSMMNFRVFLYIFQEMSTFVYILKLRSFFNLMNLLHNDNCEFG